MERNKPFTDSHEDMLQDRIYISADTWGYENTIFEQIMMEYMGERKAKIIVEEEEFAEYELISSEIHR